MTEPVLRLGGYQPETSVHTRALRHMADLLAESTARWNIDWHGDITREGHRAADLLPMVEDGALELCYFASSYLADRIPSLGVFDLPFVTRDRGVQQQKLDGRPGPRLAADVAAQSGYRVLGFWDNGIRHISNRLHPIRTPGDCRGMRLRVLDNAFHRKVFAALGFEPIVVDVKHLADAVTKGEVDAQENPLTNLVNFELHKVHRHVSLTAHFAGVALLLANKTWFDGLAPEAQSAVTAAARAATRAQREFAAAEDRRCLAVLHAAGVHVVPTAEIDIASFRAAVARLVDDEADRIGRELRSEFASA
ncbi:MAG TPA: TRAP transporter substrate-binding protein [Xanthobacteraceae bacterium]|nr:TRAP transporter substrate-binding protein [Xanthobacteraceae bacterium]